MLNKKQIQELKWILVNDIIKLEDKVNKYKRDDLLTENLAIMYTNELKLKKEIQIELNKMYDEF